MSIPQYAWIGARQHSEGTEPADLWQWVTAEPWSFTAWAPGEPNDSGNNEDCAHWWTPDGTWNDVSCTSLYGSYVVEYEGGVAGEARFVVSKTFSDGRDDEVEVTLTCNSGLPLEQTFSIAGGDPVGVVFVVTELPEAGANCEVTESGGPDGYTTVFNGGDGCAWEAVNTGVYVCEITNEADPASFTVTKEWVIEGAVGDEVIEQAEVRIYCNNFITGGYYSDYLGYGYEYHAFLYGDGDSVTVEVDTTQRSAECIAEERIYQTGVESESDCSARTIPAGGSSSCTITNTVFFEGIPTLSQYGMALLAILMLGLGFVGLRRFV